MRLQPASFLTGMFSQIDIGDDVTREKAIKFLSVKAKTLSEDLWTKEVEDSLLQSCRKVSILYLQIENLTHLYSDYARLHER